MGIVSKPFTFSPGQTIKSSEVNADFDVLYNDYNGNITDANIAPGASISASKLDLTDITGVSINVNQGTHGFVKGDCIRFDGLNYVKARADTKANAEAIGIVSDVIDVNNFKVQVGGEITTLAGLTAGTVYWLSELTDGLLTATEPTEAPFISKPMLIATSTTSGWVIQMRGKVNTAPSEAALQEAAPTGMIIPYGGGRKSGTLPTEPSGWLLCDGQAVNRLTYADLFAVIDTNFGIGDGSTTFNVPDMVNAFPYGATNAGAAGNANVGYKYTAASILSGNDASVFLTSGSNNKQDGGGTCTGQNRNMMNPYVSVYYLIKT
jgi:hypothetical protein